jgi:hypothetical protein
MQEGLETSVTGRLTSVLIPPHNLSKILQEITLRLPQDVSLIAGSNTEDMYEYVHYEVATVQACAATTATRLLAFRWETQIWSWSFSKVYPYQHIQVY